MTSSIHRFVRSLPAPLAAAETVSRARARMRAAGLGCAPVVGAGGLVGLVRAGDLELVERAGAGEAGVGALARQGARVREAATRAEALEAMLARDATVALVTDGDGAPIGWIALGDLVHDLAAAHHQHHLHDEPPAASAPSFDEQPE